jgi:phosphoglycolate phosphatase-like HAD superfamily hydrolase
VLLVLWDVDGTLVHTGGHGRYAFEEAYAAVVGRPFAANVPYAGRTDRQIALAMLEGAHDPLPRVLEELELALEGRRERVAAEGGAFPGVPETLAALHAREDVINSLLTGNIAANAALKVSAFGLDRWLDIEVGAYGSDPHEERYELVAIARERAARLVGRDLDRECVTIIGDTPHDVDCARASGAVAVAVATGQYPADELAACAPDLLFHDFSDVARAVAVLTNGPGGSME